MLLVVPQIYIDMCCSITAIYGYLWKYRVVLKQIVLLAYRFITVHLSVMYVAIPHISIDVRATDIYRYISVPYLSIDICGISNCRAKL
jgi:hypothetical protein